ncbi:hypothetical protein RJT34_10414 [Clitoria ternatea]|uniref:Uncharacterized protein n=1 Tax=Clitoria ternatea TaxID=43366 RepID=A0AAN9K620_CLITE
MLIQLKGSIKEKKYCCAEKLGKNIERGSGKENRRARHIRRVKKLRLLRLRCYLLSLHTLFQSNHCSLYYPNYTHTK